MSVIEDLFNIIAPHQCLVCESEGDLLCEECALLLTSLPERCYLCERWSEGYRTCTRCRARSPLYSVYTAVQYEGAAKDLLHALKFSRAKAGARTIARMLSSVCPAMQSDTLVTYVPTAPNRVRERGYDQAALIAKEFSRISRVPCCALLARRGSQRQVGQTRQIRKQQMADAFRPLNTIDLQGKHILIIDDVLTTGATCEAAANTLRKAGAKHVSAAIFAVA